MPDWLPYVAGALLAFGLVVVVVAVLIVPLVYELIKERLFP